MGKRTIGCQNHAARVAAAWSFQYHSWVAAELISSQLAKCLIQCAWMHFTSEHFANSISICSKFVRYIGVGNTLQAHYLGCNSLSECQCTPFKRDNVQFGARNGVSFVRGGVPEQISHVCSFHSMVGWIAMGLSGIRLTIPKGRNLLESAATSTGVVSWNHCPGYPNFRELLICKQYAFRLFKLGVVGGFFYLVDLVIEKIITLIGYLLIVLNISGFWVLLKPVGFVFLQNWGCARGGFARHITKQKHHKYMRCIRRVTAWYLFSQEDYGRTEFIGRAAA